MTGNTMHLSILTLNINGLDVPIKRYRLTNRVYKTRPNHMLFIRDSTQKNTH
jgi:hypothetical protein